jgi:predicted transcriptional regulator
MRMEPYQRLGDLQHAILRVLWEQGEATVARVHAALQHERHRALTTIATMLTKMEKKGIVEHRLEGRQFVYRATVSEAEVTRSMVAELTERFFEGDVTALVSHLIREQEIDADELERLRRMIAQKKKEAGHGG